MLIDWFTVVAQIVNFLVLVWLLKRFLYGRIIRAVDAREARIAARLSDADTQAKNAAEQLAQYQAKLADVERERDSLLAAARADADRQHGLMIVKARDLVAELEAKWRDDLERERLEFLADLRRRAASEIILITRRVIADLACMEVQHCAVHVFLDKIRALKGDDWRSFAGGELSICSAFEIPEDWQAEIRNDLENRLGTQTDLRFQYVPEMGIGIELRASGCRVGWNSSSYLERLEEDMQQALTDATRSGPSPAKAAT